MTTAECSVETVSDGTVVCSLHKQPLEDITFFEEVKDGKYTDMVNTCYCLGGKKELTTPFTWKTITLSGDRGNAMFGENDVCPVGYRLSKRGGGWRGWVWHAKGHPYWHPIVPLNSEPFTLLLEDGRRLKVVLRTEHGAVEATSEFF